MKTFPSSETVLLGSNSPPVINPNDDLDIDFRDVFGGPPRRRSKVQEVSRHSFSETADSYSLKRDVIDGALIPREAFWDGRDEKPVFGEESTNRRRFTTDDFFNDIFRVNESSSGSPLNKTERESFGSLPGSRILSPARTSPLKPESTGTSFPAQFSLPAKLIKATEIPTFGSATRGLSKNREIASSSPLSRSSSQEINMASSGNKVDLDGCDAHEVTGKSRHFHFSIYKWPNKGVPVVSWGSSRLSSMTKAEETTLPQPVKSSDLQSTSVEKTGKDEKKTAQKHPGVQSETDLLSEQSICGVLKADQTNVKPEDSLSEREVRRSKSKGKKTRDSNGDSRSKKKPQGTRSSLDTTILPDKSSFPSSSSSIPEVNKDGVKGKVMDFVKIFSQEADESLGQSSRWRANNGSFNAKETINIPEELKKQTSDLPTMDQDQKPSQGTQQKDSARESVNKNTRGASEQEERQEPSSTAHTTTEDTEDSFNVTFQVKEITEDENKIEQPENNAEEVQNIDAKIRKWSNGKGGNIRSLLSTLQYILWPGSGWKAVPLMDMIEGNAVRRSYQKALLILHPDKLQQKGASANQKYMAEKVFELLQEAWDHFNTLGPV